MRSTSQAIVPASFNICLLFFAENEDTQEYAVDGLRQVISLKGRVVLPYIVPKVLCFLLSSSIENFQNCIEALRLCCMH